MSLTAGQRAGYHQLARVTLIKVRTYQGEDLVQKDIPRKEFDKIVTAVKKKTGLSLRQIAEDIQQLQAIWQSLEEEIDKEAKSSCYIAIPAPELCKCINKCLIPNTTEESAIKIIDQTNQAWAKCCT